MISGVATLTKSREEIKLVYLVVDDDEDNSISTLVTRWWVSSSKVNTTNNTAACLNYKLMKIYLQCKSTLLGIDIYEQIRWINWAKIWDISSNSQRPDGWADCEMNECKNVIISNSKVSGHVTDRWRKAGLVSGERDFRLKWQRREV